MSIIGLTFAAVSTLGKEGANGAKQKGLERRTLDYRLRRFVQFELLVKYTLFEQMSIDVGGKCKLNRTSS